MGAEAADARGSRGCGCSEKAGCCFGGRSIKVSDGADRGGQDVEDVDPVIFELDNMLAILDDVEVAGVDMQGVEDLLVEASLCLLICS